MHVKTVSELIIFRHTYYRVIGFFTKLRKKKNNRPEKLANASPYKYTFDDEMRIGHVSRSFRLFPRTCLML